MLATVSMF